MARTALWKGIAGTLAAEVARGHFPIGARLPSEAELSVRFGVNRHTVRHALANLAERGLVHARRGAGVFVLGRPTDYPLGRRVRFHQAMESGGRLPSKQLTRRETRPSDAKEAQALGLVTAEPVLVVEGLSSADGQPLAVFRSVFPAARLPGLAAAFEGESSITRALAAVGVADYTRASTRLSARAASTMVALALQIPEGAPVLRTTSVNVDGEGVPVEFGTTWFAGERVTLTVTPEAG